MYFFYLDESGHTDYSSSVNWYVLTALGIRSDDWESVHNQVNSLKRKIFNRNDIEKLEIKSNWLRQPRERERIPWLSKLNSEKLKLLGDGLYEILLKQEEPKILLAVVINKKAMQQSYGTAKNPSESAYEVLLDKISLFLKEKEETAIIICDRYARHSEDKVNKRHMRTINKNGYTKKQVKRIQENLFFVNSELNNMIQLADLCAYNVFRACQHDKPEYEYFQKILRLFHLSKQGVLFDKGITIEPNPEQTEQTEIRRLVSFLKEKRT